MVSTRCLLTEYCPVESILFSWKQYCFTRSLVASSTQKTLLFCWFCCWSFSIISFGQFLYFRYNWTIIFRKSVSFFAFTINWFYCHGLRNLDSSEQFILQHNRQHLLSFSEAEIFLSLFLFSFIIFHLRRPSWVWFIQPRSFC